MNKVSFELLLKNYSEKKVLILPSPPTPNGSLHAGHIAGPYLRSDLLKRFLEILGADVKMILGVDAYDTYIELEANKSKKSEIELVAGNVERIKNELNLSRIDYDEFINPIDYADRIQDLATVFSKKLLERKKIEFIERKTNYWNKKGERVITPLIQSNCLICNSTISGVTCEECGSVFNFYELKDCFHNQEKLTEKEDRFLIAKIQKEQLVIPTGSHQPLIRRVVEKFVQDKTTLEINLVHPFKWGIELFDNPSLKLLTYSNRYVYYYFLGDIYSELTNNPINPYEAASNVEIISIYGKDNIISNLLLKGGLLQKLGLRQEAGCISNDYYLLNHEKFSTSRNNKVAVSELLQDFTLNEIRYYLTLTSPSNQSVNFSWDELKRVCENEIHPLMKKMEAFSRIIATEKVDEERPVESKLQAAFYAVFLKQETAFSAHNFAPEEFLADFGSWVNLSDNLADAHEIYFWLKATLLFLYPIMPDYARKTWNATFDEALSFHAMTNT